MVKNAIELNISLSGTKSLFLEWDKVEEEFLLKAKTIDGDSENLGITSESGHLSFATCYCKKHVAVFDPITATVVVFFEGEFLRTVHFSQDIVEILALSCDGEVFSSSKAEGSYWLIRRENIPIDMPKLCFAPTSFALSPGGETILMTVPTLSPAPGIALLSLQFSGSKNRWVARKKWIAQWAHVMCVSESGMKGIVAIRFQSRRILIEIDVNSLHAKRCAPGVYPLKANYLADDLLQIFELLGKKSVVSIWGREKSGFMKKLESYSIPNTSLEDFDREHRIGVVESPNKEPKLIPIDGQIQNKLDFSVGGDRKQLDETVSHPTDSLFGELVYLSGGPGGHIHPGYSPLIQEFNRRGWRVRQPELSCHDSNSRELDGGKWVSSDLVELDSYIKEVIANKVGPLVVFGHSYGTLLALRWAAEADLNDTYLVLWGTVVSVRKLWDEVPSARLLLLQYYNSPELIFDDFEAFLAQKLKIPTFMISGDKDSVTPMTKTIKEFAEGLDSLEKHHFKAYENLGHWTFSPKLIREICEDIDSFVRDKNRDKEL